MSQESNSDKPVGRFMSVPECANVVKRLLLMTNGKGYTSVAIGAVWMGNIRWGRNEIISCGDVRDNVVNVLRTINGARSGAQTSELSDKALGWAVTKAERLLQFEPEKPEDVLVSSYIEPYQVPKIWFDSSFNLLADERAEIVDSLVKPAEKEGLVASGYIQVSGEGRSVDLHDIDPIYIRQTKAQLSVTVRDPKGLGSGWAGVDWNDWSQIGGTRLTQIAIDKCLKSRNPVGIEPGRYNVVLEPQAVHDLCGICFAAHIIPRGYAELKNRPSPYSGVVAGTSKIGLKLFDERISVVMDPMDPNCSLSPVIGMGEVLNRAIWVEKGVLINLSYNRDYGIKLLGINSGLPSTGSYSMSGGTTSIEDMISRTERGLLVTRFSNVNEVDRRSLLLSGYTRDGLWLIERGKISKPVKNMRFTESPFHTLNNIVELGVPQRVFSPNIPAVVPAIMSTDFSFTATVEAI